jgi:hypothetical protein
MPGQNWSRPLPRKMLVTGVINLSTLADVRVLLDRHLPSEFKDKATWRHVTGELEKAAGGAETEDIAVALRLVLYLEGVTCVMK